MIAMRPFTESLPMSLLQAREATMRSFRPLLAEHALTEQQWRVLRALVEAGTPLELGELGERTALLGPSLTRIVSHLHQRGVVERTTARHDLRRAQVELTDAGRKLVGEIAPRSEAAYQHIERQFGKERLHRLLAELQLLAELDPAPRNQNEKAS